MLRQLRDSGVCSWLIERARGRLRRARVYDSAGGVDIENENRTNTIAEFNLADADLVHVAMQTRMAASCGIPLEQLEAPAVLHYDVGEQIGDHFDFVDPKVPNYADEIAKRGERVVTFLVYLNDDYGGGETDFPALGMHHKGASGEGLFFVNALASGGPDTAHAARGPTAEQRREVDRVAVHTRPAITAGAVSLVAAQGVAATPSSSVISLANARSGKLIVVGYFSPLEIYRTV